MWFGYDNNAETKSNSGQAAWAWKQFMNQVKGSYAVQNFPPKPVLTRTFKDRRRPGSQRTADAPLNGDQTDTDPDVFSSGEKLPEAITAPRVMWLQLTDLRWTNSSGPCRCSDHGGVEAITT